MLNKLISKLICILGCWYLKRKINQFNKGDIMKCICTLKGFELSIIGCNKTPTTNEEIHDTLNPMINREEFNISTKIEEQTTDIEMDKEEFIEINKLLISDGQYFLDNGLTPLIAGLDKYATRCMNMIEKEQDFKHQKNTNKD